MSTFTECSLLKEIKKQEAALETCYEKIESLKEHLKNSKMSGSQRQVIESELREVTKLLTTNQKNLKSLHGHNRQTFRVALAIGLIIFAVWMLYILISGSDF